MKLSEAIMLGAMLRPQCRQAMFKNDDGRIGSCALGAAYEATFNEVPPVGSELEETPIHRLMEQYPIVTFMVPSTDFPNNIRMVTAGGQPVTLIELGMQVIVMNDTRKWTRQQIAEWVAFIEDAQEAATAITIEPAAKATALAVKPTAKEQLERA